MEQTQNSPNQRRRLVRTRDGRMIAGVASGIGDFLDINPWIVRAGFIALTFAGASGLIIYVLLVLALPTDSAPDAETPLEWLVAEVTSRGPVLAIAVLVLFLLLFGVVTSQGHLLLPLILIGGGLLLFRDRWEPALARSGTGTVSTPEASANVAAEGVADTAVVEPVITESYGRRRRREHRPRSPLGAITFGLALVSAGILAIFANEWELKAQQVVAIPILILGTGLFVGTFYGRARSLIVPIFLLLPFAYAGAVADMPIHSGAGSREYRPASITDVRSEYTLGAGRLVLDLSKVDATGAQKTIDINQNAGLLAVVVPKNVPVSIDANGGAGRIDFFGREDDGLSPHLTQSTGDVHPNITLHLRNGFGRTMVTDNPNAPEVN